MKRLLYRGYLLLLHPSFSWIFSMLFNDFRVGKQRNDSMPQIALLTEFYCADADIIGIIVSLLLLCYDNISVPVRICLYWGCSSGEIVKALNCGIIESGFKLVITFTFGQIPRGKA